MPISGKDKGRFVFKGTIVKAKAATMASVPATASTFVVTVDEVLEAPPILAGYEGKEITIRLAGRGRLRAGQQALFRANAWLFGESVAVRVISHTAIPQRARAAAFTPAAAGGPARALASRDLEHRLRACHVAVTGRVSAVRRPSERDARSTPGRRAARGGVARPRRISEHDPLWREAVIDVDTVVKGRQTKKQVVVRFPSSDDVRWRQHPKFVEGQQGLWLLHKETAAQLTAPHAEDFQTADRVPHIRQLLKSSRRGR